MKRRKSTYGRIVVAWLLLVTLTPVYVVKALHYHEAELDVEMPYSICVSCCHVHHDCPICNFVLLPFIPIKTFFLVFFAVLACDVLVKPFSDSNFKCYYSYALRAPPIKCAYFSE